MSVSDELCLETWKPQLESVSVRLFFHWHGLKSSETFQTEPGWSCHLATRRIVLLHHRCLTLTSQRYWPFAQPMLAKIEKQITLETEMNLWSPNGSSILRHFFKFEIARSQDEIFSWHMRPRDLKASDAAAGTPLLPEGATKHTSPGSYIDREKIQERINYRKFGGRKWPRRSDSLLLGDCVNDFVTARLGMWVLVMFLSNKATHRTSSGQRHQQQQQQDMLCRIFLRMDLLLHGLHCPIALWLTQLFSLNGVQRIRSC